MPNVKQIGLKVAILTVGDRVKHRTANYTAVIITLTKGGSGRIRVEPSAENLAIWGGKIPAEFLAKNLFKHFTKIYLPNNQTTVL